MKVIRLVWKMLISISIENDLFSIVHNWILVLNMRMSRFSSLYYLRKIESTQMFCDNEHGLDLFKVRFFLFHKKPNKNRKMSYQHIHTSIYSFILWVDTIFFGTFGKFQCIHYHLVHFACANFGTTVIARRSFLHTNIIVHTNFNAHLCKYVYVNVEIVLRNWLIINNSRFFFSSKSNEYSQICFFQNSFNFHFSLSTRNEIFLG